MAQFPAMPLWTDAYLADTTDLSAEEHGVYLLLLMAAWRSPDCSLPNDDIRLSRMARIGVKKWQKMRPVMQRFFTVSDNGWTQKRLLAERSRVETSRSQASQAGKASALKRQQTKSTDVATEQPTKVQESISISRKIEPKGSIPPISPTDFDEWYQAYPHKVGKGAARKAYATALKKTDHQTLIRGVEIYRGTKPPDRPWCNPATWLNQERWTDEPEPPNVQQPSNQNRGNHLAAISRAVSARNAVQ